MLVGLANRADPLIRATLGVVPRPGVIPLSILPVGGGYSIQTLTDWSDITLFTREWPYVNTTLLAIITGSAVVSLLPLLATRQKGRFA